MPRQKPNKRHKDTLFRLIFGEHKEYALALYNAINKTDYKDIENLKVITLEDALYVDIKNDVGYIFHDIMNLIEHQSTYNPNMPLRGLGYFADSYIEYVSEAFEKPAVIYSGKLIHIPAPRYYVLYNGRMAEPEEQELRLSDAYDGEGDIEVVAHMLNINKGHNATLLEACEPLRGYSELIDRIRQNRYNGSDNEEAISEAIDSCIEDGILEDILRKERDKVANFLYRGLTEEEKEDLERLNRDYYRELGLEEGRKEGRKEGLKEGREEGRKEGLLISACKLIESGKYSEAEACELLGVDIDSYRKHKRTR